jgi:hypothetical protein
VPSDFHAAELTSHDTSEPVTVNLQNGSDASSCSSSEEVSKEFAEEDDGEFSGI